ncbi:MAG TPA: hypothetical protein VIU86_20155 [Gaiellaceae bacterium]|jgi:hypothetical protein
MPHKSPICWNGFVFVHTQSDDLADHYTGDGAPGRLTHSRTHDIWMACLREAKAYCHGGPEYRDDKAAARAALDAALEVLRRRVAADRDWIRHVEREIG